MSQIVLPEYRKIAAEVKKNNVSVSAAEVEDGLFWLRKSRAKFSQLIRPCHEGDFVEVEFTNTIDNQKYKDAFVLGEGKFVPGFEENILGMSLGEEKSFKLKLPRDYIKKDLAGKEVSFWIKLYSVQKMELPELNDEFARSLGNFSDLAAVKKSMLDGLYREKEIAESQNVRGKILDKITDAAKLDLSEDLIRAEQKNIIEFFKQQLSQKLTMSISEYLAKTRQTEKEIEDSFSAEAEKRAKETAILSKIAEEEGIAAGEDEIKEATDAFLKRYRSPEEAQKNIDPVWLRMYIENTIRMEKTLQLLEGLAAQ